jgi:hypothetical protein
MACLTSQSQSHTRHKSQHTGHTRSAFSFTGTLLPPSLRTDIAVADAAGRRTPTRPQNEQQNPRQYWHEARHRRAMRADHCALEQRANPDRVHRCTLHSIA